MFNMKKLPLKCLQLHHARVICPYCVWLPHLETSLHAGGCGWATQLRNIGKSNWESFPLWDQAKHEKMFETFHPKKKHPLIFACVFLSFHTLIGSCNLWYIFTFYGFNVMILCILFLILFNEPPTILPSSPPPGYNHPWTSPWDQPPRLQDTSWEHQGLV